VVDGATGDAALAPRRRGRGNPARWNKILAAAGEVFAEKGYRATTIDDIAAKVGLLPGSLYYYIESKEHLLREWATSVLDRSTRQLLEESPELADADARGRLGALIDRLLAEAREAAPYDVHAVIDAEMHRMQPEQADELKQRRQPLIDFMEALLEQGIQEGHFDPDLDFPMTMHSILRLVASTPKWFASDSQLDFDDVAHWYKVFVLRGLRP
jgi:AcrR family transcriptional regulator